MGDGSEMKICTYQCTCSCPEGDQTEGFQFPAGIEHDAVCEGQSVFPPGPGLTPQLHTRPFEFDTESMFDRYINPMAPSGEFQDFVDDLFKP